MDDVTIAELDLSAMPDADWEQFHAFSDALHMESRPDDPPRPLEVLRTEFENVPEFVRFRFVGARLPDGSFAGAANVSWGLTDENRHLASVDVNVHPEHRRRGIAKALLRPVVDVVEEDGRSVLMGSSNDRVPAGEAFARRTGAEVGLLGHTNRLLISAVDREMIARWIAEGPVRAPGYSLVAIDGRYPDDLVEPIIDVLDVMNTAPREGLDMEDQNWTVEQIRQGEESMAATKRERWHLAARHDASGDLVGFTEVSWVPHEPATVWQWGTAVRPEHRGHALGKWLKATMLKRILDERPGVVDVRTHNADSNEPMLGINRLMGFEPYRTDINWQVPVEDVKAYLASTKP
jgi:mycothiol synthase